MEGLFEYNDILSSPYEAFVDGSRNGIKKVRPHWHYYAELIYIITGSVSVTTDNQSYVASKGDVVLFFPRAIHSLEITGLEQLSYYVIKFDINKLNVTNSYTPKISSIISAARQNVNSLVKWSDFEGLPIKEFIEACVDEYRRKEYGYDLIMHGQLTYVLIMLIRIWRKHGLDIDRIALDKKEDSTIYNITEYIDEHSGELINIQNLAKICNMSYSYFAREFKRLYGRSCKEYIEFVKTSKVENMLMFTDFDLNYISQETGFSDSSHLIKTFKRQKGVTPKQFKKNRVV